MRRTMRSGSLSIQLSISGRWVLLSMKRRAVKFSPFTSITSAVPSGDSAVPP